MTKKRHTVPAAHFERHPARPERVEGPFEWRINPEDGEAERDATAEWVRNVVGRGGET